MGILGGGGLRRKGSKDPPDIYIRKISRTHIEEAVQEDFPSRLGETQESDALVTPHLTVQDTGQVPEKGHPVIGFGAIWRCLPTGYGCADVPSRTSLERRPQ